LLTLTFNGTDERVIAWLKNSFSEIAAALRIAMLQEMIAVRDVVVEEKLSGQVLKNKTGTLRRSQHESVTSDEKSIRGAVSTDPSASAYGYVHEYGGTFDVKAHMRKSSHNMQTWVREHSITFPERSFLRSTLNAMAPEIVAGLQNAADEWVARKNQG
jgi:hypothetical protein